MNTVEPPHGGPGNGMGPEPPSPVAVQQTTVIQVGTQKSVAAAVLLALFFGPLGMLYATIPGALIMIVVSIIIVVPTLGLGLLITLPICAIWAGIAANSYNQRLQGVSSQQAMTSHAAVSPAGWHDDPGGSGRLRYYDGMRWTDQYAAQAAPSAPPPPAAAVEAETRQLEPPAPVVADGSTPEEVPAAPEVDEDPENEEEGSDDAGEAPTVVVDAAASQVFCGACGQGISPTARFCPACGETQATA